MGLQFIVGVACVSALFTMQCTFIRIVGIIFFGSAEGAQFAIEERKVSVGDLYTLFMTFFKVDA